MEGRGGSWRLLGEVLGPFWSPGAPGDEEESKTDTLDLSPGTQLGHQIRTFCRFRESLSVFFSFFSLFPSVVLEGFRAHFRCIWGVFRNVFKLLRTTFDEKHNKSLKVVESLFYLCFNSFRFICFYRPFISSNFDFNILFTKSALAAGSSISANFAQKSIKLYFSLLV